MATAQTQINDLATDAANVRKQIDGLTSSDSAECIARGRDWNILLQQCTAPIGKNSLTFKGGFSDQRPGGKIEDPRSLDFPSTNMQSQSLFCRNTDNILFHADRLYIASVHMMCPSAQFTLKGFRDRVALASLKIDCDFDWVHCNCSCTPAILSCRLLGGHRLKDQHRV